MDDFGPILCTLVFMVITGTTTGVVAHFKGRNVLGWSALGAGCGIFCIFGFVPLIVVAALPSLKEEANRDAYFQEENRRLREQLRQERIKSEAFRQHTAARLDAHDQHLGLDTRSAQSALGAGIPLAGELGPGSQPSNDDAPRWYYGFRGQTLGPVRAAEIIELIKQFVITRETLVWAEELVEWRPAAQVASFAMYFT